MSIYGTRCSLLKADWSLSPCHWCRCVLIRQLSRLYQYSDIQGKPPIDNKDSGGCLLVSGRILFGISANITSCYNAFSRLDMRVHVTIPGTVDSYCVDERGDKRDASDLLWLETYLCSVLRAYSYADDGSGDTIRKIMGVRRFNPVTSTETEHRFLQAAEALFFRGALESTRFVGYTNWCRMATRF
jgi:hypothetical protein